MNLNFGSVQQFLEKNSDSTLSVLECDDCDVQLEALGHVDLEREIILMAHHNELFANLIETIRVLSNLHASIEKRGCTKEHVTLFNEELANVGIVLKEYKTDDALVALEALIGNLTLKDIKRVLMEIIDAIIDMYNKITDKNKVYRNQLNSLLSTKLASVDKLDKAKFADSYITAYSYNDFDKIVSGLASIDVYNDVGSKESISGVKDTVYSDQSLADAVSNRIADLLKVAGYVIDSDRITRVDPFPMSRETTRNLGWSLTNLPDAAKKTSMMLEHLRSTLGNAIRKSKSEVSSISDDSYANRASKILNHRSAVTAVVGRVSISIASQLIEIIEVTKPKQS